MDYYCGEFTFINLNFCKKKALRFMTNSGYIAHTTPLLIKHGLLNPRKPEYATHQRKNYFIIE